MERWINSFCIIAIELWGAVYFFDIFMERKRTGWLDKSRYMVLYAITVLTALLDMYPGTMVIKVLVAVLELMVFCVVFYKAELKQCIFFSHAELFAAVIFDRYFFIAV